MLPRAIAVFSCVAATIIACSEGSQTPDRFDAPRGDDDDKDDDDDRFTDSTSSSTSSSGGGAIVDAATGGAAVSYRGTLAKTSSAQFGGGSGHCRYNVTMDAIEIELAITPEGNVIGGTAKNTMTETVIPPCAYAALGTKPMSFAFASMSGQTLTWAQGATSGAPKTNLTITLAKSGAGYDAAAKWVRADRTDDLQWTVATSLTLAPK